MAASGVGRAPRKPCRASSGCLSLKALTLTMIITPHVRLFLSALHFLNHVILIATVRSRLYY